MVLADLPGVSEAELSVEVTGKTLKISGNRPSEAETFMESRSFPKIKMHERRHGPFLRALSIPQAAREDEIRAELKLGVLTVVVPKQHAHYVPEHKITVHSR
jgi:HSP20 family protein